MYPTFDCYNMFVGDIKTKKIDRIYVSDIIKFASIKYQRNTRRMKKIPSTSLRKHLDKQVTNYFPSYI